MSELRFGVVTISYGPDFERCALLSQTFKQYVEPSIRHTIVVDRRDEQLFSPLRDDRTEILTVESILPPWVFRLPLARRWWFSAKTPPVRNWILQQFVKLSMPLHLPEDVLLYVDSDVAFVRPFHAEQFVRDGNVRLLRMPGEGNLTSQYPWHRTAAKLLGLPPQDYFGARYIGNIVSWKRDNVLRLHQHIEETTRQDWRRAILSSWHLSEYILYGVFIDQVLGEGAGHYADADNICHEYWLDQPMSRADLRGFFQSLMPEHVAVMISAKAGIGVSEYRELVTAR